MEAKEYAMRAFLSMVSVVVALVLQGCAGTDVAVNQTGQQSLRTLQLFKADSTPRFAFYLACTSEDASCATVEHAFFDWESDRHVTSRLVEADDALFTSGIPSFGRNNDLPYRVAVRFVPLVVPSFTQIMGNQSTATGGYTPPKVGYTATIYVFDSATGKLLQELPAHEERTTTPHGHANGYIHSEVNTFLARLDPAYSHQP
jgi:hypothetical protein